MLTSLNPLKSALLLFIFFCATQTFAQSSYQILEGNALNDAIYKNIKEGKPQYEGMDDLYVIKTDNMKQVTINNANVTNRIKAISGVLSCSFDITNYKVNVVFKKPTSKDFYTNDTHLAELKAVLSSLDMTMLESKLCVIKK